MKPTKRTKAIFSAFLVWMFFEILRSFFFSPKDKSAKPNDFLPELFLIIVLGVVVFLITKDEK